MLKRIYILCSLILVVIQVSAQVDAAPKKPTRRGALKDTLDGKFDFSSFLIDAHGFFPMVFIITEPALGGFGGAVAPMFMTPKKGLPQGSGYVPPDITAGFGMYTANGSWALGGGRMGSIPRAGIKYRFGAAYADINMNFYRETELTGEKEFLFNIRAVPIFGSISKKIIPKGLYAGIQYSFARTKVYPEFSGNLPDFINKIDLDNKTSALGAFLDWDSRNTVFTPDKGLRAQFLFDVNAGWTGSDFDFQKLYGLANWYIPVRKNWVSGLRVEGAHVFGTPPFYLLPFINLRGIPIARYQGQTTMVVETEQRYDMNLRWSLVGFAGWGRYIFSKNNVSEGNDVYNLGGGFRYLIARAFKLRMGIDIAKGPDSWGWYIVFGHNWNR